MSEDLPEWDMSFNDKLEMLIDQTAANTAAINKVSLQISQLTVAMTYMTVAIADTSRALRAHIEGHPDNPSDSPPDSSS